MKRQFTSIYLVLCTTFILSAYALQKYYVATIENGSFYMSNKIIIVIFVWGIGTVFLLLFCISLWKNLANLQEHTNRIFHKFFKFPKGFVFLAVFLFIFVTLFLIFNNFYCQLYIGHACKYLRTHSPRYLIIWLNIVALSLGIKVWKPSLSWKFILPFSMLALTIIYELVKSSLFVNSYPLALWWSESTRYYLPSLYFSDSIYGMDLPWTIYHPSRYLLQSIPYIFSGSSLWVHRLWQSSLWILSPIITSFALSRRLKIKGISYWLFFLWAYLFLRQGPIHFHLLPCVFIILLTFNKKRFWYSLFFIVIASIWAGISRVNWLPIPGLTAAILFYLETPVNRNNFFPWKYFLHSITYFIIGLITAITASAIYISLSGSQELSQFGSAFSSDLIWSRLLPNNAFFPGILLGTAITTLPLIFLIIRKIVMQTTAWHPIRLLGIFSIVTVLFIGALVVSIKIGGGTNMHNMDVFMIMVLLVSSYLYFDTHEKEERFRESNLSISQTHVGIILVIPALFQLYFASPPTIPEMELALESIQEIDHYARQDVLANEEILFIAERHLITFDMLSVSVPLVPEYERLHLMEMAISRNSRYLEQFYSDIISNRFNHIVIGQFHIVNGNSIPLRNEETDAMAPEHNAWVTYVAQPLLCFYEPVFVSPQTGLQILQPRETPACEIDVDFSE